MGLLLYHSWVSGRGEWYRRPCVTVAKAVDPELVAEAITAIYGGLMAVVATLRVKFAACVTLGVTVGGIAHNIASTHLEPVLTELTPPVGYITSMRTPDTFLENNTFDLCNAL